MTGLLGAQNDQLFGGVNDFFDSTEWHLIRNLGLFFVFVFWLATIFWVFKDARRRIADPWLVAMAVLLPIVVPFIGPLIYMLFRPPEYLEDVRERELEIKAMEQRLARRDMHCPVCTTRLRQSCRNCKQPLEALWQVCPYCETPMDTPAAIELGHTAALEPPRRERRSSQ